MLLRSLAGDCGILAGLANCVLSPCTAGGDTVLLGVLL